MRNPDVNLKQREVYFYPSINDDLELAHVKRFHRNLNLLSSHSSKPITVYMGSYGGATVAGLAMYDIIRNCRAHVTIEGFGAMDSAGTIILQGADWRAISQNCEFLVHSGYNRVDLKHEAFMDTARYTQKLWERVLGIYVDSCSGSEFFEGQTRKEIRDFLVNKLKDTNEWYLTPREALKLGFVDEIIKNKRKRW